MKNFVFILMIITLNLFAQPGKGGVLTGERFFNRVDDAWLMYEYRYLLRDVEGTVTQRVDYDGTGAVLKTWNCTHTDTSYVLRYDWYGSGYKTSWHGYYIYVYDLEDTILSYTYHMIYSDPNGTEEYGDGINYTYSNGKIAIIETYDEYAWGHYNFIRTVFTYDISGYPEQEIKQFRSDSEDEWIDKERTLWTWDGIFGTGTNEIYKNTVWINKGKTSRIINEQIKPISDQTCYWSWGFWINQYEYITEYVNEGVINRLYTNIYNPATKGYDLYKLHNYYYENFGGMSAPGNLITTIAGGQITLNWYAVTGSTGYKVYSSDDPFGTFEEDTSGTFNGNEWTAPISDSKKFYKVTAISEEK
ncbi:MAG TPA: hypothetical protein PLK90_06020 [Clostridiales bacterium]|nr:hypothetical protein [Clostridiales bacterium]HQP69938.1 hypothetical protein [Clostridiales bacterium]